jgi:hypothetical protein
MLGEQYVNILQALLQPAIDRALMSNFSTDNPMCPCEEAEDQTTEHLIFQCKKLHNQRTDIIKKIKNARGDWPMTNETLVNDY